MEVVTLTFEEFARKLLNGATLRFDKKVGQEFIEWFSFWYKDIVVKTTYYANEEKLEFTI